MMRGAAMDQTLLVKESRLRADIQVGLARFSTGVSDPRRANALSGQELVSRADRGPSSALACQNGTVKIPDVVR